MPKETMKKILDFNSLSDLDKDFFLNDSWCDKCSEADLGIVEPEFYIENERQYISGKCTKCREVCISEVVVKEFVE
jgi:hypothetical protein